MTGERRDPVFAELDAAIRECGDLDRPRMGRPPGTRNRPALVRLEAVAAEMRKRNATRKWARKKTFPIPNQ